MARYNRNNLDGKSVTETRKSATKQLAGRILNIVENKFKESEKGAGQLYVINRAWQAGKHMDDELEIGLSLVGDYFETGREFAVRADAGEYKKDTPLKVLGTNVGIASDGDVVLAYSQEDVELTADELLRIRVK